MKKFVINMKDNSIGILTLIKGDILDSLKKWTNFEDISSYFEIDKSTLPTEREFRDAWTHDGQKFGHDFNKARDIQLLRLRIIRDALLYKYDGLQSRANDLQDKATLIDIKTKKQQLRDATEGLKSLAIKSIDEIKKATPDLGGY